MIRFAEINYETLCYETASLRNGFAYETLCYETLRYETASLRNAAQRGLPQNFNF